MSDVMYVDDSNFEIEVLKSKVPVLVNFGTTWAGPCQRLSPIIEKFATENVGKVKVCKVDIDDSPLMTSKMGVRGIPALHVFKAGVSVGTKVGFISFAELNNFVMTKIG